MKRGSREVLQQLLPIIRATAPPRNRARAGWQRPARQPSWKSRAPTLAALLLATVPGCGDIIRESSRSVQHGDPRFGVVYYVGGAGPIGNVGSLSIPQGLEDAGFKGIVEVFPWQSLTAIDQVAIERNKEKGTELARLIRRQFVRQPNVPIHVIGLSAGTVVATFAMERLPESTRIESVTFLASSMSSRYDLTRALRRIRGGLYSFYSPSDEILRTFVPFTGTADRRDASEGIAGLNGLKLPVRRAEDTRAQYAKVHNIRHKSEFSKYGNHGGHTDGVSRAFIAEYVARIIVPSPDHGPPPHKPQEDSVAQSPTR